ncbi:dUTP diphosphatase [Dellaglioa carnosa]|uniref:dUTP diphosphatase n=1 Tax=Dellaglioa carnosa TaxID=2995136 RepID=UPI0022A82FB3|nr:dUTP diphosphatase [Dellaglioa carnosa]MCZ2493339.1 dUTP diphosphatase [Dellaglioa carnosa]
MKTRGFEIVTKYADDVSLPVRSTKSSAGYDLAAAEDFVLPSIWKSGFLKVLWLIRHGKTVNEDELTQANKILKPYLIPTGIKAYMQDNEFLLLANRSSSPLKRGLILPNGIGVIDSDYYNNQNNEGEIFIQIVNFSLKNQVVKKGDRVGQGIFMPYLTVDDEKVTSTKRVGGFGSSGK